MRKTISAIGVAVALIAGPASAQVVGGGLVVVNISDVANDIALDLDVDVADVLDIGSVQVPIGIAANVCPDVDANVLAHQRNAGDTIECDATSSSRALSQIVQRQLISQ